mmetsp:Transcript_4721/g.11925  ORF Transcript_4721/g.11925 Transcript_4721/m.11925 type:complete len:83 (+) Transcript_4721:1052-1300(+)
MVIPSDIIVNRSAIACESKHAPSSNRGEAWVLVYSAIRWEKSCLSPVVATGKKGSGVPNREHMNLKSDVSFTDLDGVKEQTL